MKFTVKRTKMLDAMKTVLAVVPDKSLIEEIRGVLFTVNAGTGTVNVAGTDLQTWIEKRVPCEHISEDGELVLKPIVSDMLRLMSGETVEFEQIAGALRITCGSTVYDVPYIDAASFPKFSIKYPENTIRIQGINSLIKRTVFAAEGKTDDKNRVKMQFVKLTFKGGNSYAEATNGNCTAISASPHCADGNLSLIVHEKALQILSKIVSPDDEIYVGSEGKIAVFMRPDTMFITLLHTGDYVEGSKIMSRLKSEYGAITDTRKMADLLENATSLFRPTDDQCINISIRGGKITARGLTSVGRSEASIDATHTVDTAEEGFNYKPKLLLDCLKHSTGPLRISMDKRGFLMFEANQSRFLVCPRREVQIKKEEPKKAAKPKTRKTKAKTAQPAAA